MLMYGVWGNHHWFEFYQVMERHLLYDIELNFVQVYVHEQAIGSCTVVKFAS